MDTDRRCGRLSEHEAAVLEPYGTPVYAFFEPKVRRNYRRLREALDEHYADSVVHFAVKANYEPGVLSVLRDEGCHAEVYGGGELSAALEAGYDPADLLVTGMNRRVDQVIRALDAGVPRFLVDNETELEGLIEAAGRASGDPPKVLIRGNPAIEVPTDPDIATATRESKFGLDVRSGRAMAVAERAVDAPAVELAGVQLHLGSQITDPEPYAVAAREMCRFAATVRDAHDVDIEVLDLGGGFPVPYDSDVPPVERFVARIGATVREACDEYGLRPPTLFLEPGRRLIGDAGALFATVGVVKETPYATFAVLDAGTNAISSHWPYPVHSIPHDEPTERYHVAGPLCYSGDVIAEDVPLPPLDPGDVLAIDRIGAYSLGSASHTNGTPKPPVVLVRMDGTVDVIRDRETEADVLRNSRIPEDLL